MNDRVKYVLTALSLSSHQKAAEELFVAPQTISKAVADAERRHGKKLFRRKGRGIEPTEFGVAYLEAAKELLAAQDLFDKAIGEFQAAESGRETVNVLLAQMPLRGSFECWFDVKSFSEIDPSVALSVSYCTPGMCLAMLEGQKADMCVLPGAPIIPQTYIAKKTFIPIRVLVGKNMVSKNQEEVTLEVMSSMPLALPFGVERCAVLLEGNFMQAGLPVPKFVSAPLSIEGSVEFVKRGGAILTGPNNELVKYCNDLAEAKIGTEKEITMVSSLVVSEKVSPKVRSMVEAFLTKSENAVL